MRRCQLAGWRTTSSNDACCKRANPMRTCSASVTSPVPAFPILGELRSSTTYVRDPTIPPQTQMSRVTKASQKGRRRQQPPCTGDTLRPTGTRGTTAPVATEAADNRKPTGMSGTAPAGIDYRANAGPNTSSRHIVPQRNTILEGASEQKQVWSDLAKVQSDIKPWKHSNARSFDSYCRWEQVIYWPGSSCESFEDQVVHLNTIQKLAG